MKYRELKYLVYSDLYRITKKTTIISLLRNVFFGKAFKYNFWMRVCSYTKRNIFLKYTLFPIAMFILRQYTYKFGISVSHKVKIGSGLYFGHFGGIIIHPRSIIGKNCNIQQGVTLGEVNRGENKGTPIIGDNVYIGPGAKIIGAVKVGNNVAIGSNCVVTKDVEDNGVVVGVPGKVISYKGSTGYISRIDYDKFLIKK